MIQLINLCKQYDARVLFSNFELIIDNGEFVVFSGASGCGKTTLLNMIGGIENPDSGEIVIDGVNICREKHKKDFYLYKVGFLFQNFALLENMTVRQNLQLIPRKARTNLSIEEALSKVGLKDMEEIKTYKLSGGEQQRVALARLMLKKCDIVLADEPTGSLDERNASDVMKILHQLNDDGKTVIVVTHNPTIIEKERRVVRLA